MYLVSDANFGLRLKAAYGASRASYFFLEIDRSTMTIILAERVRESDAFLHRSTVMRKLVAYAESWQREHHQAHLGISAPQMLMLATSAARVKRRIPPEAFLFGQK